MHYYLENEANTQNFNLGVFAGSTVASGEFEVLAVICQLLPVPATVLSLAILVHCYLASILRGTCKLPSTLPTSFLSRKSGSTIDPLLSGHLGTAQCP